MPIGFPQLRVTPCSGWRARCRTPHRLRHRANQWRHQTGPVTWLGCRLTTASRWIPTKPILAARRLASLVRFAVSAGRRVSAAGWKPVGERGRPCRACCEFSWKIQKKVWTRIVSKLFQDEFLEWSECTGRENWNLRPKNT